MMQLSLAEASKDLVRLVETVLSGEEVIILKDDRPVAKLTSLEPAPKRRQPGSAKGLVWISDDFDEPLEEFKE